MIDITNISTNRNGISGVPYWAILFDFVDDDGKKRKMIATVFDEPGTISVFDVDEIKSGNIGENWRGDFFESQLRLAIKTEENKTC